MGGPGEDSVVADDGFPDSGAEIGALLVVSDLARSLDFYVQQLGAKVVTA